MNFSKYIVIFFITDYYKLGWVERVHLLSMKYVIIILIMRVRVTDVVPLDTADWLTWDAFSDPDNGMPGDTIKGEEKWGIRGGSV